MAGVRRALRGTETLLHVMPGYIGNMPNMQAGYDAAVEFDGAKRLRFFCAVVDKARKAGLHIDRVEREDGDVLPIEGGAPVLHFLLGALRAVPDRRRPAAAEWATRELADC